MIVTLAGWTGLAYRAPRVAARRILERRITAGVGFVMIVAGVLLNLTAAQLAELIGGRDQIQALNDALKFIQSQNVESAGEVLEIPTLSLSEKFELMLGYAGQSLAIYLVAAALAYGLGSALQGTGSFASVMSVTGLWTIIRAPAHFVSVLALVILPPASFQVAIGLGLGIEIMLLYLYASFIAEAHGFESAGRVMGVAMAVSVGLLILASAVLVGMLGG